MKNEHRNGQASVCARVHACMHAHTHTHITILWPLTHLMIITSDLWHVLPKIPAGIWSSPLHITTTSVGLPP